MRTRPVTRRLPLPGPISFGRGLEIDVVFDDTAEGTAERQSGSIDLTQGRHSIRVRMQNRGAGGPRLYLYWSPPGGTRELVPGRALYPPPPAE